MQKYPPLGPSKLQNPPSWAQNRPFLLASRSSDAIFVKIMTLRSKKLIPAIALELSDGELIELRRVPYLHDVFVDTEGRAIRLTMPEVELHTTGRVCFRYGTSTMMLSRVMLDTYYPGWDDEGNRAAHHIDGDPANNSLSNLEIKSTNRPGRPASNIHRRLFSALQLLDANKDVQRAAKEFNVSQGALLEACKTTLPDLYDAITALNPSVAKKRRKENKLIACFGLSEKQQAEAKENNRRLVRKAVEKRAGLVDEDDPQG